MSQYDTKKTITAMLTSTFSFAQGSGMSADALDEVQDHCDAILALTNEHMKNATAPSDVTTVDGERRDRRKRKSKKDAPVPNVVEAPKEDAVVEAPKEDEPIANVESVTEPAQEDATTASVPAPAKRGRKKKVDTA